MKDFDCNKNTLTITATDTTYFRIFSNKILTKTTKQQLDNGNNLTLKIHFIKIRFYYGGLLVPLLWYVPKLGNEYHIISFYRKQYKMILHNTKLQDVSLFYRRQYKIILRDMKLHHKNSTKKPPYFTYITKDLWKWLDISMNQ